MKKTFLLSLTILFFAACSGNKEQTNYCKYVDPFIGTAYTGHTYPGATYPFGMMQPGPQSGNFEWKYCAGYRYDDEKIWGFSQNRLNGTGIPDMGDLLMMPFSGNPADDFKSHYDKASEKASPGYYTVKLTDHNVTVELTATPHVAMHKYNFGKDQQSVYIDFQSGSVGSEHAYNNRVIFSEIHVKDENTIVGHQIVSAWTKRQLFFVMKFNRPFMSVEEISGNNKAPKKILRFESGENRELYAKVAYSMVSIEGAEKNLETELKGWDFDKVRKEAENEWNKYLSRIQIEGSLEQKKSFYTSVYHLFIQPHNIADIDGSYRGATDSVAISPFGKYYSTFSLWDTYRAAHPMYTILTPELVPDMVNSMLIHAETYGYLPIWALWGKETYCMIGNHSVPVVVEACLKNFPDIDYERAFRLAKKSLTEFHRKYDWKMYDQYGYFPFDLVPEESVSRTLESGYDDYCVALLAEKLNKQDDYAFFMKRSDYYKNLFDPMTKLMRGKDSKGNWRTPFNTYHLSHAGTAGGDYTEGNAWQYTWHVQQDIAGLIDLLGGKTAFVTKLDSVFVLENKTEQTGFTGDVTGLIGQYAHGNEPSHHLIYLYTMAGKNNRTAELVREVFDQFYKVKPDGLCGNDDCGQMSAWYMFSAMGFYPVNPASGQYIIGAPQLPKVVIQLPSGKSFTVIADKLSEKNKYVKSVKLNNTEITDFTITYDQIMNGGNLVFEMTDTPLKETPLNIIFETDMGNDIDDALALDMLFKYLDQGRINLLGIMSNKDFRYSPEYIDILNTFYGYPDIPIGIFKKGEQLNTDGSNYDSRVCLMEENGKPLYKRTVTDYESLPAAPKLYRKLLSQQPDHSVTIISTGFSTNLAALLKTTADEYSPLNGRELVAKKVKLLSAMAGSFDKPGYAEYNVLMDVAAARETFEQWPSEIVFSPYELGDVICYPATSIENDFNWTQHHPMTDAYRAYAKMPYDRPTWDPTSVLYALEPEGNYFTTSRRGTVSVINEKGVCSFTENEQGKHIYLMVDADRQKRILDYFVNIITKKPLKYKD